MIVTNTLAYFNDGEKSFITLPVAVTVAIINKNRILRSLQDGTVSSYKWWLLPPSRSV